MLFRMEFFIEGKHLEKVLAAVAGVALNMKPPQPVVNAVQQKDRVKQASSGTTQLARVIDGLAALNLKKGDKLLSTAIYEIMQKESINKVNFSYIMTQLKNKKYLKTTPERGTYIVLSNSEGEPHSG